MGFEIRKNLQENKFKIYELLTLIRNVAFQNHVEWMYATHYCISELKA